MPSRRDLAVYKRNVRRIRTICENAEHFLASFFQLSGGASPSLTGYARILQRARFKLSTLCRQLDGASQCAGAPPAPAQKPWADPQPRAAADPPKAPFILRSAGRDPAEAALTAAPAAPAARRPFSHPAARSPSPYSSRGSGRCRAAQRPGAGPGTISAPPEAAPHQ